MVSSNNGINNTVGASISGVTNTLTVTNASNTASSAARETIVVGGGTAGDPTINWNVSGVTNFEMGLDNSDSDKLKISQGTALGTNDTWVMDTSGRRTMPLQPAFLAYLGASDSNVTGDGSSFVLGSGTALTEVFDQGNNFNTNGTFTAPITGRYFFSFALTIFNVSVAHTVGFIFLTTTNGTYDVNIINPGACKDNSSRLGFVGSAFVDMNAGDTATLSVNISLSGKTVGVRSNARDTFFSGFLVC